VSREFPAQLREAIDAHGYTVRALAAETGLSEPTIFRYLSGARKPNYDTSIILERALPRLRELRLKATA
jgi:transcriptional regulator with XRE-family HTH domain